MANVDLADLDDNVTSVIDQNESHYFYGRVIDDCILIRSPSSAS